MVEWQNLVWRWRLAWPGLLRDAVAYAKLTGREPVWLCDSAHRFSSAVCFAHHASMRYAADMAGAGLAAAVWSLNVSMALSLARLGWSCADAASHHLLSCGKASP